MEDLLVVNSETQTVSARELHEKVGSSERFSAWFDRQLQFGFDEGIDYSNPLKVLRVQKEGSRDVTREVQDYQLSIDMAKQICMVQKNEKAKQIRQYLIDLEKAWNTPEQVFARALKLADEKINSLWKQVSLLIEDNKRMRPKEIFADAVSTSDTSILIGRLAKIIKQNGVDIGQNRLFKWMRDNGYLVSRKGSDRNMPTQRSMDMGLFEIMESTVNNPDGSVLITKTPKVTGKGQQYFINKFLDSAEE